VLVRFPPPADLPPLAVVVADAHPGGGETALVAFPLEDGDCFSGDGEDLVGGMAGQAEIEAVAHPLQAGEQPGAGLAGRESELLCLVVSSHHALSLAG
jgi:hypothetical protein